MSPKARTFAVTAGAAVAAALLAWFWPISRGEADQAPASAKSASASPSSRVSSNGVAPAQTRLTTSSSGPATPSPGAAARAFLLEHDDWKSVLAQIDSLAWLSAAEKLFYKALILDACSIYPDMAPLQDPALLAAIKGGTLDEWIAKTTTATKSPAEKAARQFNAHRNITNVCRNFAGDKISRAQITRAWEDAAAAGDLRALARLVQIRRYESGAQNGNNQPVELARMTGGRSGWPSPMTAADREVLVNALLSGDPIAIRIAGNTLSLGSERQSFRFGAEQTDLGQHETEIWNLVACQFGLECGARNVYVATTCAERGWCGDDYLSYLRDSALPPNEFEFVQRQALAIADAIRRGDRSAFQLVDQRGSTIVLTGGPPPPVGIR